MIKIPIEELLKKTNNNRYLLTILVANRAAKVMETQRTEGNLTVLTRKVDPISQALEEIMADKHLTKSSTMDLNSLFSADE